MPRPGGKGWLAEVLREEITARPHKAYIEPFAGALGAFNARLEPSRVEVVNDIDGELINLLRQVRRHPDELVRTIGLMPCSRGEHKRLRDTRPEGLTEIERAARYWYLCRFGFGGGSTSFGTSRSGSPTRLLVAIGDIAEWAHRLAHVVIEELPWHECIRRYDAPDALFFCDPPYIGGEAKVYAPWTETDLEHLVATLGAIKGSWIVTMDDHPAVRTAFAGCCMRPAARKMSLRNTPTKRPRAENQHELVITRKT